MNIYPLIRPILFSLDPETAHNVTLKSLNLVHRLGLNQILSPKQPKKPLQVMGLTFRNRLGLAAGLDKNGDCIDALADLDFGFIEIGTVTPRPQPGNPKPRLFRLPDQQAIINRMGFNNNGVDYLLAQVAKRKSTAILGINIGKNADTPIENAADDYLIGFQKCYLAADYITLNISSPNTKNLRQLQQGDEIKRLIETLKNEQLRLEQHHQKYTPLVVKIAPDLGEDELRHIGNLLLTFEIDGVIATNTTIARDMLGDHPLAQENGGLSGAPVRQKSTAVVTALAAELGNKIPIIAAGGILSTEDAQEKLTAGATLIQIYSGLIYQGPRLISDIIKSIQ